MTEQSTKDYPLFIPPVSLATRKPREWSRKEADAFAAWFHSVKAERLDDLPRYFDMDGDRPPASLLEPLGQRVAEALRGEPFSREGKLTNAGYALAADMGLLLARALEETYPSLTWSIVRRPKSDVSYNCPILLGFGKVDLDPIAISVTKAFGVLSGHWTGDGWQRLFEIWGGLVQPS